MATIPLREYCREIENMIDKGHTEEASGHCRHILKHFPKHIETYRLLGKSYLESRQLGDAADIFQRVLSSIPEDFVSHIGMSIIREDEGNLDASIWHMERAFEGQSSNLAIQDELKRLYTNRDGQEPPKIRLTRGALAYMYAHGHLYSQAIAELRAALTTDPKRLDLQVLLAKMYHADKQTANSAKTASQLLTKLPYCLDANQILAEILTNSQRASEAAPHRARVQELDPYYKHISVQYPTVDMVPSGVIVLEALDWEATKGGLISQPAWATSIGVDISNAPASEELPEWLSPSPLGGSRERNTAFGDSSYEDNLAAFASPTQNWETSHTNDEQPQHYEPPVKNNQNEATIMQQDDNDIPDWMKSAGWGERDPNTPEEPPTPLFDDEEEAPLEEGEIAKASLPDWLKAMAPSDIPDTEDESTDTAASADIPDWLQGFNSGETAPSRISQSPKKETPSVPSWLKNSSDASDEEDNELPSWLGEDIQPTSKETTSPSLPKADMPDWLKDMSGAPEDSAPVSEFNLDALEESTAPDWLQEFGEEVVSSTLPASKEKPSWLSDENEEISSELPAMDDIFGEPEKPTTSSGASWLDELTQDEEDPSLHSGVTDWLSTKEQEDDSPIADSLPMADVPDWLHDLGQELPESTELSETEESVSSIGNMDASFEMGDFGKDTGQVTDQDFGLEDDAMAWLESLAAKQGAKEEELLIKSENRQDANIPSWLEEITDETTEEPLASSNEDDAIPDWLREVANEPETVAQIPEEDEVFDLGDTLKMEDEEEFPSLFEDLAMPGIEEPGSEVAVSSMEDDEDAAMAWLEALAAKHGAKEEELLTAPTDRSEDIPEWLHGITDEEPSGQANEIAASVSKDDFSDLFGEEEAFELDDLNQELAFDLDTDTASDIGQAQEPPMAHAEIEDVTLDEDAGLAWLESLAMKHGVNEEELLTAIDSRPESTPDWVNVVADEARAEEAIAEQNAANLLNADTSDDMDFLAELAEEAPATGEEDGWMEEETLEPIQAETGSDSAWLADLFEDEPEAPVQSTSDVPDWLTASTADLLASIEENAPEVTEAHQEESGSVETDIPAWLMEEEEPAQPETEVPAWILDEPVEKPAEPAEFPAWILEEEKTEEPPLPIFKEQPQPPVPAKISLPTKKIEPEPEPEPVFEAPVMIEAGEALTQARATLSNGDVVVAAEYYEKLIKSNQNVDEAINDITEALNTRYPVDIGLWQALGDGFVKKNKLQDALDAYTKAEELLR